MVAEGGWLCCPAFMNFTLLTMDRLEEARRLVAELFWWESEHQAALAAALSPTADTAFHVDHGLASVRCWVAQEDGRVVGLACLYGYAGQPGEVWLAWFGLRPEVRGRGQGARFLDWIITLARGEGRTALRLWTTDEEEYGRALELYLRRGFACEECPPFPGEEWKILVLSLGLDGRKVEPWFSQVARPELCGRKDHPVLSHAA